MAHGGHSGGARFIRIPTITEAVGMEDLIATI